jgi:YebC/PmpR family DNA-binding regulatory protein
MSGHSKWHNIQGKKSVTDAKRGKIFTKIGREIIIAARDGGGNPESNYKLRAALDKASAAAMPKDNIKRAIQRGTGEIEGATYEEALYEGIGPAGVAIIVEALTDSKNRTISEFKKIFSKHGGNLGEQGCVAWNFVRQGEISMAGGGKSLDDTFMVAADAGAEDVLENGEDFIVTTPSDQLHAVSEALKKAGYTIKEEGLVYNPKSTIKITGHEAEKLMKLQSELEDHDDTQKVFTNSEMDDAEMERISALLE